MDDNDWESIVEMICDERCVPFLGAGASLGFDGPGLPTGGELAQSLAASCGYPGSDRRDLFRVAQFYEMKKGRYSLQRKISALLDVPNAQPSLVHRTLAAMPFSYFLTTNFDNLMETALADEEKEPTAESYQIRGNAQEFKSATPQRPLVYKLHGSLDDTAHKLIVTEDDVVEFLCCLMMGEPPLPHLIKSLFEDHSILFIGYGLKDWNIRVLLRAIRGGGRASQDSWIRSFAVQRRPEDPALCAEWDTTVAYWDRRESLKCFDIDAREFSSELQRRFESAVRV